MGSRSDTPLRLLVVLPSWVGDTVMATPALSLLRQRLPGAFIGALARPGVDQLLYGSDLLDEIHTARPHGVMAPKRAASKVRGRGYDTALLLTNSFSTALVTRMAFIPRRIGYDRDGRRILLTDPVKPPRNPDGSWKLTPAVDYYWNLASHTVGDPPIDWSIHTPTTPFDLPLALPKNAQMSLPISDSDREQADRILSEAGLESRQPFAILNPGGNNHAKRWPADRYAKLSDHLAEKHNLRVLVNGSPAEAELCEEIISLASSDPVSLPALGNTLGSLKALCHDAALLVTNDTGPRHIAGAFATPLVTLFGPTDPRWTTIPVAPLDDGSSSETILVADPALPESESANDHPERCSIDRIEFDVVRDAVDDLLSRARDRSTPSRRPRQ